MKFSYRTSKITAHRKRTKDKTRKEGKKSSMTSFSFFFNADIPPVYPIVELEGYEMLAVSRNIASLGVHACLKRSTNAKIVGDITSPVASNYFAFKKSLVTFNGSFALQSIFTGIRAAFSGIHPNS